MQNRTHARTILLALTLAASSFNAPSPEQTLFQLTNRARAAHNLPPLHWDNALATAAKTHVQRVRNEPGELLHQYPGEPDLTTRGAQAGAHFTTIAENVGRGTDVPLIHQTWMNSPSHRANILDPNLNAVGISVAENRGLFSAAEDFSRSATVQSFDSLEKRVAQILLEHGIAQPNPTPTPIKPAPCKAAPQALPS
jgi:uncharacterized protein YkwD